ncbi:MAG TPA: alpha/beta hydrolase [Pseudonocardia sp.]|jgi:pimeloyl-ACP methyl ester carboxylesterase|nr:alpha/beta hydrolase [Pseudonocardia sp.]
MREFDVTLPDGRTVHGYDSGSDDARCAVVWHHGTPQAGPPPSPSPPGIRWISYDRPGYGTSTRQPDRSVADAAGDVAAIADACGIDRFAVMGASGGGPHVLACAALLPSRILGAVTLAGLAPFDADGLEFCAGMTSTGETEFRTAAQGHDALTALLEEGFAFGPDMFTPADMDTINGVYGPWLGGSIEAGNESGVVGFVDDDLAFVRPWGFDPADITAPQLVVHGTDDRIVPRAHGDWLARRCPAATHWSREGDGHVSIFEQLGPAVEWLSTRIGV